MGVDPGDRTQSTATFPVSLPCLGARAGQSILAWAFESKVLKGRPWDGTQPLVELSQESTELVRRWPPTLVAHGDRDGLASLRPSQELLSLLAAEREGDGKLLSGVAPAKRPVDVLIVPPGCKH